jgi:excisionase family DNA binding protein
LRAFILRIVLLRVGEVAERLSLRRATVYRLIRDGLLPSVHVGRVVRVPQPALEAFIAAGGTRRPSLGEERAA